MSNTITKLTGRLKLVSFNPISSRFSPYGVNLDDYEIRLIIKVVYEMVLNISGQLKPNMVKVGERVEYIYDGSSLPVGATGTVGRIEHEGTEEECIVVKWDNPQYQSSWSGGLYSWKFKSLKNSKVKTTSPLYLVIWDENRDPVQFFKTKSDADAKIEQLKKNSSVKMDSIILVEIKSANRVVFKPTLESYKIY